MQGIFTADVITTGNSGQVMYELLGKNRIFNYVPSHYVDRIPSENRDPLLIVLMKQWYSSITLEYIQTVHQ
jgi:hypothetical protein